MNLKEGLNKCYHKDGQVHSKGNCKEWGAKEQRVRCHSDIAVAGFAAADQDTNLDKKK